MSMLAKTLMLFGVILFCAGALLFAASKLGLPFGKLPGDIAWQGKNVKVFFPITSMLAASVVLTLLVNIAARFFRR